MKTQNFFYKPAIFIPLSAYHHESIWSYKNGSILEYKGKKINAI